MKLILNAVASYPDDAEFLDEDLASIREDVDDCLRFCGVAGAHSVVLDITVEH